MIKKETVYSKKLEEKSIKIGLEKEKNNKD